VGYPTSSSDPGPFPVFMSHGITSATFLLSPGINRFLTYTDALGFGVAGGVSFTETITRVPVPAALPLFAAGLVILGWSLRKRTPQLSQ
jgi:hypothetical protein